MQELGGQNEWGKDLFLEGVLSMWRYSICPP